MLVTVRNRLDKLSKQVQAHCLVTRRSFLWFPITHTLHRRHLQLHKLKCGLQFEIMERKTWRGRALSWRLMVQTLKAMSNSLYL